MRVSSDDYHGVESKVGGENPVTVASASCMGAKRVLNEQLNRLG